MRAVTIAGGGYYRDQLGDPATITELTVWRQMGECFDELPIDVATMPLLTKLEVGALEGYPMRLPPALATLPRFTSLTLHGVGWAEPDPLLFALPHLRSLALTRHALSSLPRLPGLEHLSIDGGLSDPDAHAPLSEMTGLRSLSLRGTAHLDLPLGLSLPELSSLMLAWPDRAPELGRIGALPSLERLELQGMALYPPLDWLDRHPRLRVVVLAGMGGALDFLEELPALEEVRHACGRPSLYLLRALRRRGVEIISEE